MQDLKISKKKPSYPISNKLNEYLSDYIEILKYLFSMMIYCVFMVL